MLKSLLLVLSIVALNSGSNLSTISGSVSDYSSDTVDQRRPLNATSDNSSTITNIDDIVLGSQKYYCVLKNYDNYGIGNIRTSYSSSGEYLLSPTWATTEPYNVIPGHYGDISTIQTTQILYINALIYDSQLLDFVDSSLSFQWNYSSQLGGLYMTSLFFKVNGSYKDLSNYNVFNKSLCSFSLIINSYDTYIVSWHTEDQSSWVRTEFNALELLLTYFDVYSYDSFGSSQFSFINDLCFFPGYSHDIIFANQPTITTWTDTSEYNFAGYRDIKVPFFKLSGLNFVFDTIRFWYGSGWASYYVDDEGVVKLPTSPYWSYTGLYYVNSITGHTLIVNLPNSVSSYNSSGDSITARIKGSYWVSDSYRYIYFNDSLSDSVIVNLNQYNSFTNSDSGYSSGGNYGLTNVFTLISNSFSSCLPFLSIEIVPGITIGLLILLPLVAGIIIAIIWVVKR